MMMGFGALWLLLCGGVLVVLLGGAAALISRQANGSWLSSGPEKPTARQILDERLARGEISQEEYDRTRRQIQ
jgi:uncharacterized membrane protein